MRFWGDMLPKSPAAAALARATPSALHRAMPPAPAAPFTVASPRKSVVLAFVLAALFGPFGLFYSSVVGGIVMLVLSGGGALVTFGLALLVSWPVCAVWAVTATLRHNARVTLPRIPRP